MSKAKPQEIWICPDCQGHLLLNPAACGVKSWEKKETGEFCDCGAELVFGIQSGKAAPPDDGRMEITVSNKVVERIEQLRRTRFPFLEPDKIIEIALVKLGLSSIGQQRRRR